MKRFFVYMLSCADGTFYTGWTTDPDARLEAHNSGTASKYTRARLPASMVYVEELESKSEAMKREAAIKRLSRAAKAHLIPS